MKLVFLAVELDPIPLQGECEEHMDARAIILFAMLGRAAEGVCKWPNKNRLLPQEAQKRYRDHCFWNLSTSSLIKFGPFG